MKVTKKLRSFIILQREEQTSYYHVEARDAEEALRLYHESPGSFDSSGSTGGWSGSVDVDVVVQETISGKSSRASSGNARRK